MLRLKEIRKKKGLTQEYIASTLHVVQAAVSQWENGRVTPEAEKLSQLADVLGVSLDVLMGRKEYIDEDEPKQQAVKIPVLGRVQAGIPTSAISEILDYEEIPAGVASRGEYFGLLVRGDSMSPEIHNGDIVIVRCQPDIESGETAVVAVNGDNATVKRVKKTAAGIILIPLNPAYEPMVYTNEQIETLPVEIKGKVVELRRKM